MKKIKISLALVAMILATGGAFATSTTVKASLAPCESTTPDVFNEAYGGVECPGDGELCCTIGLQEYEIQPQ